MSDREEIRKEGNRLLAGGLGLGIFSTLSALLSGIVCPLCVLAVPTLLGFGAYQRWRAARKEDAPDAPATE